MRGASNRAPHAVQVRICQCPQPKNVQTAKSRTPWFATFALIGLAASSASTWVHYQILNDPTYASFCDVSATLGCLYQPLWRVPAVCRHIPRGHRPVPASGSATQYPMTSLPMVRSAMDFMNLHLSGGGLWPREAFDTPWRYTSCRSPAGNWSRLSANHHA
jgi:hypothetical protein